MAMLDETVTKTYAPWVALLALISSLVVGYVQFIHSGHAERVSRVLEFAKEYRGALGPHVIGFRLRFETYYEQVVEPALKSGVSIKQCGEIGTDGYSKYSCLIRIFMRDAQNRSDYESLQSFFDALSICVDKGLCEYDAARSFFADPILSLAENMMPWINEQENKGYNNGDFFAFARRLRTDERKLEAKDSVTLHRER